MKPRKLRLKTIRKSHKPEKKYDALFLSPDGKEKVIPFGQAGYNDFIIYNKKFGNNIAKTRKQRYIKRHSGMGEHWNKPDTPGALSRWILWNKPSLKGSLRDFRKRFSL
jgi:hypothetical protein